MRSFRQIFAYNCVVQVEPNREFCLLVANFGIVPYRLVKGQTIGALLPHPNAVMTSKGCMATILGVTDEEANKVQQDFNKNAIHAEEDGSMARNLDNVDFSHVPARYCDQIKAMILK